MTAPIMAGRLAGDVVRELATNERVCVRPIMRRVLDRQTGTETTVAIACGSRREAVCPSCAHKARVLRMHQCEEGWHLTDEPDGTDSAGITSAPQTPPEQAPDEPSPGQLVAGSRTSRSTRRRGDAPDLPRVPMDDRTVGMVYRTPEGREFRPSMFLTLTLPSYGAVRDGAPVDPASYDYRRQARDTVHLAALWDRFTKNLRRATGFNVQYFATVEPQLRLAPHIHAAVRGAISHETIRQMIASTYHQVWWPKHDEPVFVDVVPVWTGGGGYADPTTGELLPMWDEARTAASEPAHVVRFGKQHESRGIVAPSAEADRAVRYLTKYLTKSITDPLHDDENSPRRLAHILRMEAELRFEPCSPQCANWLRYGVQPDQAHPGMMPGQCPKKAHDRDHLGLGGRRVLVSRKWSGKTLTQHRADRAAVVRETLLSAGFLEPEIESMAADVTDDHGQQRYVWTDTKVPPEIYPQVIYQLIRQRRAWRDQYDQAKQAVESRSATGPDP
ncbi:replication initiator [Naumannella halotolerans]|uniref:Replication initiation protein n=1 Tax=Naumannella halotolerans TaxID=993414 RepID=A0A4R7IYP3_9ACTN|nr:replication initiator [Naumannella halotolerans]TDT29087.1 hypothetical protein CLV29_3180 [Naumannella halotolerans]